MLWDSHPLALGATPQQVWIDGIAQLESPHLLVKPASFQKVPETPNFDKEARETVEYEGLPPLEPKRLDKEDYLVIHNVASMYEKVLHPGLDHRDWPSPSASVQQVFSTESESESEYQSFLVSGKDSQTCSSKVL